MSLDFRQVQEQVRQLGENAPLRQQELRERRDLAHKLLAAYADSLDEVRHKIERVSHEFDPTLRCACPLDPALASPEALNAAFDLPALPEKASVLAADGSQIPLDYHAEVAYCLINIGAIQIRLGSTEPAETRVRSRLFYDTDLFTPAGVISDGMLALMRDKEERTMLADMARRAASPVVSFTDGPMELWGSKDGGAEGVEFKKALDEYLLALSQLRDQGVIAGGYVDKPSADLVVRLLEVIMTPEDALKDIKKNFPLRGVKDIELYRRLLAPGQRSAVFSLQSQSASRYQGNLALHFFYMNVGRDKKPWIVRVELPAWVVAQPTQLNMLHAVLCDQCRQMGSRPYPYLLHRAHETAVVTFEERDQVTQMILMELHRRGVEIEDRSYKQAAKELQGRTRYS